jgi:hypothetical protein
MNSLTWVGLLLIPVNFSIMAPAIPNSNGINKNRMVLAFRGL